MRTAGQNVNGKIQKAIWVTETFPEEIEADLHRYYRLDFRELFRKGSGLTWRKLLVLIDHLPPEGAVNTAIRNSVPDEQLAEAAGDPTQARWSTLEGLTATLIDEVRMLSWTYASAHTDSKIPKPEPVKRPGVNVKSRKLRPILLERARRMDPRLRSVPDEEAQAFLDKVTGRNK